MCSSYHNLHGQFPTHFTGQKQLLKISKLVRSEDKQKYLYHTVFTLSKSIVNTRNIHVSMSGKFIPKILRGAVNFNMYMKIPFEARLQELRWIQGKNSWQILCILLSIHCLWFPKTKIKKIILHAKKIWHQYLNHHQISLFMHGLY